MEKKRWKDATGKSMDSKKCFFVGPSNIPITGQSVAFSYLKEIDIYNKYFFEFPTSKSVLHNIKFLLKIALDIIIKKPSCVYISLSRSNLGFIRDMVIIWLSHMLGSKLVGHLHGSDLNEFIQNSYFRGFVINTYLKLTRIIILTDSMKDQLVKLPGLPFSVVSNAVSNELNQINSIAGEDVFTYTYMSNLIPEKGLESFLVAFAKKYGGVSTHQFLICGAMGYDKKLDDIVKRFCSTYSNIKYVGVVSGPMKVNVLRRTHCVILLSKYAPEAQPICVLESFSIGCPVIVYSHNYIRDMVNSRNGYICEELSEGAIFNACDQIEVGYNEFREHILINRDSYAVSKHIMSIRNIIDEVLADV